MHSMLRAQHANGPTCMHIRLRTLLERPSPRAFQQTHHQCRSRAAAICCRPQGCMAVHSSPSQALDFLTLLQNLKVRTKALPEGHAVFLEERSSALVADHNHLGRMIMQKTKRTGWVRKGIMGPESIADHMYRMSMMAFICNDSTVDSNRYLARTLFF